MMRPLATWAVGLALVMRCEAASWPDELSLGRVVTDELGQRPCPGRVADRCDAQDHPPSVGRTYQLRVVEPQAVCITLQSCFFDAWLQVRGQDGEVLGEDDDGYFGTHARLWIDVEQPALLLIDVGSWHGRGGPFELAVSPVDPGNGTRTHAAAEVIARQRDCLDALTSSLGPDHPDVGGAYGDLGVLLAEAGRLDEGRSAMEQAVAILGRATGAEFRQLTAALDNLAQLLEESGEPVVAFAHRSRALAIREQALGPDDPELATSFDALAANLESRGEMTAARPLYERSLRIREAAWGEDDVGLIQSLEGLGRVLHELGDLEGARAMHARAMLICDRGLDPGDPSFAVSATNLAAVLGDLGRYDEALGLQRRVFAFREASLGPDHPDLADVLDGMAVTLVDAGQPSAALPLCERALAIREGALGPDHELVAESLNNLGGLRRDLGDPQAALVLCERAYLMLQRSRPAGDRRLLQVAGNVASLLQATGRVAEARDLCARILDQHDRIAGWPAKDIADTLNTLASLEHEMGELDEAREHLERALALYEEALGPEHPGVARATSNLALVLLASGDPAGARGLFGRCLAAWEATAPGHPDAAACLANASLALLDAGDITGAEALLAEASQRRGKSATIQIGALSEAEALRYVEQMRWQLSLRLSTVAQDEHLAARGYADLLAWKGQVLRMARLGRQRLRAGMTPDIRSKLDQLGKALARLPSASFADGLWGGPVPDDEARSASQECLRLQRELAADIDPAIHDPPAWEELRSALPTGAALVDMFIQEVYVPGRVEANQVVEVGHWSEPRAIAWITRSDSIQPARVDLGPIAAIERSLAGGLAMGGSARGVPAVPRASLPGGRDIADLLWDPLEPHLVGCATLFISPDGVLAALPFEILRHADGSYLVETHRITYLSDPTDLARAGAVPSAKPRSLLALGDVDYDVNGTELPATEPGRSMPEDASAAREGAIGHLRGWTHRRWEKLAATGPEVAGILALHRETQLGAERLVLAQGRATEELLKQQLPRFSMLHLATHGYFLPDELPSLEDSARDDVASWLDLAQQGAATRPVQGDLEGYHPGVLSGLVCAGANANLQPPRDDGYLTAEEVGWLDLSGVDLVVLSACDTGLGRPQSGEGLLGLRRAFLTAGAKTVISSLWSVPDQETAELMDLFYRNLWQRGLGKHEALREAQLAIIRRNRERFDGDARPATWGAFVVDGDWR